MKILLERRDRSFLYFPWKATSTEHPGVYGFAATKRGALRDFRRSLHGRDRNSVIETVEVDI